MSISKLRRARAKALKVASAGAEDGTAAYVLPPTVSRGALLETGSDRRFRTLVNDLFTIASRMEIVRAHLGRRMGISGPQYSVLIAVAHLQGRAPASASGRLHRRCTCRAPSSHRRPERWRGADCCSNVPTRTIAAACS